MSSQTLFKKLKAVEVAAKRLVKEHNADAEIITTYPRGVKVACVARKVRRFYFFSGIQCTWSLRYYKGNSGEIRGYSVRDVAEIMELFLREVSE